MRKLFVLLVVLSLLLTVCAFAEEEEETVLEEGQILMHGYIDPYNGYYVGVPAEWAIIGPGSTASNISEANDMFEDMDARGIYKALSEDNPTLLCLSEKGAGLILTYGDAGGASNDTLIDQLETVKTGISAAYNGVTFKDDCGSYSYNSIADILYIGMRYKNTDIYQYYIVSGQTEFIFTFFGTTAEIAQTVLSTFSIT